MQKVVPLTIGQGRDSTGMTVTLESQINVHRTFINFQFFPSRTLLFGTVRLLNLRGYSHFVNYFTGILSIMGFVAAPSICQWLMTAT